MIMDNQPLHLFLVTHHQQIANYKDPHYSTDSSHSCYVLARDKESALTEAVKVKEFINKVYQNPHDRFEPCLFVRPHYDESTHVDVSTDVSEVAVSNIPDGGLEGVVKSAGKSLVIIPSS